MFTLTYFYWAWCYHEIITLQVSLISVRLSLFICDFLFCICSASRTFLSHCLFVWSMTWTFKTFKRLFTTHSHFDFRRFLLKDQTVSEKEIQKRERFGVLRPRQLNTNDCLFDGDNWRLQYIIDLIYMCVSGELEWDERELYTGELAMCELCTGELSACEQTFHNSPPVNLTLVVERWSWQKTRAEIFLAPV